MDHVVEEVEPHRRRGAGLGVGARLGVALLVLAMVTGLVVSPAAAKSNNGKKTRTLEAEPTLIESQPVEETVTEADTSKTDSTSTKDGEYDPVASLGSMYNVVDQIGARKLWHAGFTGDGVDVAVIDTGIAQVPALSDPDKVAAVVDLSFEATVPEAVYLDTFGHGTHITGIIAGRDPGADPATAYQRPGEFVGVAPDARVVSVKVGDNTGAADVSQVIAAIDWVVQHRNAGDLNIRVLNLSYGTDSTQDYRIDPLAAAVERAWQAGIVVVAASGNDGWTVNNTLTNPAMDPYIIAVSAAEATEAGMVIPEWSNSGAYDDGTSFYWQDGYTGRRADLFAPGSHIDSLRVPQSRIATEHPEGFVSDEIFRGSGSSQAAAVVSGAVALLLEHRPELTPDEVKAVLRSTTARFTGQLDQKVGQGLIDVAAAAAEPVPTDATQTWERSTGLGSLEASRGTQHVTINGALLAGEITAYGDPWDPKTIIAAANTGTSWTGSSWTGSSWTGSSWTGSSWTGSSWTGSSWTGSSWTGSSWTGSSWTGSSWTGSSWTGSSWTGSSWT